jgi:hypothetical protein
MSKEKLDLVQLATGKMAKPHAAAAKIMRREFFNSGARCGCSDDFPQHLGRHASSPDPSGLVDRSKERAFGDAAGVLRFIARRLRATALPVQLLASFQPELPSGGRL